MNRILSFCAIVCASLMIFASCEQVGEAPQIVMTTTSDGHVFVGQKGGSCSFSYKVMNPREDGKVSLEIPSENEWLSNPVVDQVNNKITVTVQENTVKEERSETVTLRYTYGKQSVTTTALIKQGKSQFDYVVNCTEGLSIYCESDALRESRLFKYRLVLSDSYMSEPQSGSYCYTMDLIASKLTKDKLPKAGSYIMTEDAKIGDMTITNLGANVTFYEEDVDGMSVSKTIALTGALVDIEKDDNGVYSIEAMLVDEDFMQHLVRYKGELILEEITIHSTLRADVEVDLSDYVVEATNEGAYKSGNYNNWMIRIFNKEMKQDDLFIVFDALVPEDMTDGFAGNVEFYPYSDGSMLLDYAYLPGEGGMRHSWMLTIDSYDSESGQISVKDPSAPFCDGVLNIESGSGNVVNVSGTIIDDSGYKITLRGENMPITYKKY